MSLRHWLPFFHQYTRNPGQVGAIAPSSPRLAAALLNPFRAYKEPARVLEIGAGTGAITQAFEHALGSQDRLDICELRPEFVRILQRDVLGAPQLRKAADEGRLNVYCCPAQEIDRPGYYDFVICGLPFNSFERGLVEAILEAVMRNLAPRGVFSYFEYLWLGGLVRTFATSKSRQRMREVSELMADGIAKYEFRRDYVFLNLPPASARHWRRPTPVGGGTDESPESGCRALSENLQIHK